MTTSSEGSAPTPPLQGAPPANVNCGYDWGRDRDDIDCRWDCAGQWELECDCEDGCRWVRGRQGSRVCSLRAISRRGLGLQDTLSVPESGGSGGCLWKCIPSRPPLLLPASRVKCELDTPGSDKVFSCDVADGAVGGWGGAHGAAGWPGPLPSHSLPW